MANDHVERNRALQSELYGEPLGELFRRVGDILGLTQARLADVLGMSAPMLSQLISAQRAKIGNPAVVQRVHALIRLADEVAENGVPPAELEARVGEIKGVSGIFVQSEGNGNGAVPAGSGTDPRANVRLLQGIFRAVATADELGRAARKLDREFPELAELLRVYGTGRTDQALAHFERVQHLV